MNPGLDRLTLLTIHPSNMHNQSKVLIDKFFFHVVGLHPESMGILRACVGGGEIAGGGGEEREGRLRRGRQEEEADFPVQRVSGRRRLASILSRLVIDILALLSSSETSYRDFRCDVRILLAVMGWERSTNKIERTLLAIETIARLGFHFNMY